MKKWEYYLNEQNLKMIEKNTKIWKHFAETGECGDMIGVYTGSNLDCKYCPLFEICSSDEDEREKQIPEFMRFLNEEADNETMGNLKQQSNC